MGISQPTPRVSWFEGADENGGDSQGGPASVQERAMWAGILIKDPETGFEQSAPGYADGEFDNQLRDTYVLSLRLNTNRFWYRLSDNGEPDLIYARNGVVLIWPDGSRGSGNVERTEWHGDNAGVIGQPTPRQSKRY